MTAEIKIYLVLIIMGTIVALGWLDQGPSERPISVTLDIPTDSLKHKSTKVVLHASDSRNGLSHGEVRLDFVPANTERLIFDSHNGCCVQGHTDTRGVFVANWTPFAAGEYIVAASVKKAGFVDGYSMCSLRVSE